MKVVRLIQFFFLVSAILVLGEIFDIDFIRLISRIVILPILFAIYYKSVEKVNYALVLVFFLLFLGNISTYYDYNSSLKFSIIFFGFSNALLAVFSFTLIKTKSTRKLLLYSLPVAILWLVYYEYYFDDTFGSILGSLYPYVITYSVVLGILNILANVSFFNEGSKLTLYLIIIGVTIVVGDVLMCIYIFANPIHFFKIINIITNLIASFFILKFAISYTKLIERNSIF
ncbi:hypothetical protein GTQ40_07950 [Flavobacteriaceae bacterium R38]|nr:hypothetical protein [Flavobacteriaceae bacterium R38]